MICACGCGVALTGKQTKWASRNCQHRAMWQERKESQAIQRRERRRLLRAAEVIATTPDLRKHLDCEHRHGRGKCWKHAVGCQTARASGFARSGRRRQFPLCWPLRREGSGLRPCCAPPSANGAAWSSYRGVTGRGCSARHHVGRRTHTNTKAGEDTPRWKSICRLIGSVTGSAGAGGAKRSLSIPTGA